MTHRIDLLLEWSIGPSFTRFGYEGAQAARGLAFF
jgi:hypothetical protein